MVGLVLTQRDRAAAAASVGTLSFSPTHPLAGTVVEVHYRPAGHLVGDREVRLRGRIRGASIPADRNEQWALLRPRRDGVYVGRFELPAQAAYGVFAVEDTTGERIDPNNGRLWDLRVSEDGSKPGLPALDAEQAEWAPTHFPRAHQAALRATELFPRDPLAWSSVLFFADALSTPEEREALLARHRERFADLHVRYEARTTLPERVLRGLTLYAQGVGDSLRFEYWRGRLVKEAPNERRAVQERMATIFGLYWKDQPMRALDSLEVMWKTPESRLPVVGQQALILAQRTGVSELVSRWTVRLLQSPETRDLAIRTLLDRPEWAPRAMDALREDLEHAPDDATRPLDVPRSRFARVMQEERGHTLALLGRALFAAGRVSAAADTLLLASKMVWDRDVFASAAEVLLSAGDTVTAAEPVARLAADPLPPGPEQTRLIHAVRQYLGPDAWAVQVRRARREMISHTNALAERTVLHGPLDLVAMDGSTHARLRELVGEKVAVIAFWSRYCGYSLEELPALRELGRRLEDTGVPLVVVSADPVDSDAAPYLRRQGYADLPLYFDQGGAVNNAFRSWETPTYFIVDSTGDLRFSRVPRSELLRHVEALRAAG